MKAKLILLNWTLSWVGLVITEPFIATMIGVAWFLVATLILLRADKKGTMEELLAKFENK